MLEPKGTEFGLELISSDFGPSPFVVPSINEDKIDFGITSFDLDRLQNIFPNNADIYNLSGLSYPEDKIKVERISITHRDGVYHFTLKLNNLFQISYDININTMEYDGGVIIKAGNDTNSYQELIVNRLYYMRKVGIKKVNINACRRNESGQQYYGYNIWGKYGYDVHGEERKKILELLSGFLNQSGLSYQSQCPDELIKEKLKLFLNGYIDGESKLLMPLLFEDDVLSNMRRQMGSSFNAQMILNDDHPTRQYFVSKFPRE